MPGRAAVGLLLSIESAILFADAHVFDKQPLREERGNNAVRNNPSYHFGASPYWCAAYVAVRGCLGTSAGRHPWRYPDRGIDPRPFRQDLRSRG
jgi:hypothetical protein